MVRLKSSLSRGNTILSLAFILFTSWRTPSLVHKELRNCSIRAVTSRSCYMRSMDSVVDLFANLITPEYRVVRQRNGCTNSSPALGNSPISKAIYLIMDLLKGSLSAHGEAFVAFYAYRDWTTFVPAEKRRAREIIEEHSDGGIIREKFGVLHLRNH
jgi:hypothetical protein